MAERLCVHCGKWFDARIFGRHVVACERRPSREGLERMLSDGLTQREMARQIGVSTKVLRDWMQEEGLKPLGQGFHKARLRRLERRLDGSVSPFFGQRALRCEAGQCKAYLLCRWLVAHTGWVLCEAPDRLQRAQVGWWCEARPQLRARLAGLGVDVGRLAGG